jgi:hypothetical protein
MKKTLHSNLFLMKGNTATATPGNSVNGFARNLKRAVLALFCCGLMLGTTSCCKSIGCGTWGKVKVKTNNKQYACYNKFNR